MHRKPSLSHNLNHNKPCLQPSFCANHLSRFDLPTSSPRPLASVVVLSAMAFVSAPHSSIRSSNSSFTPTTPARRPVCHNAPVVTPRMTFGQTVKETLESNPRYGNLVKLAAAGGVDLEVSNCTVFAPTNGALSGERYDELLADPVAARNVVLRHILPDQVLTSKAIKGCSFWDSLPGGPLPYEGIGPVVKIAGVRLLNESSDDECDNGTIHVIDGIISTPLAKPTPFAGVFEPSVPMLESRDDIATAVYPPVTPDVRRAFGAASAPSTVGGRKAMGLIKQLPFWMYGPPFNASKQEDFEPISIANPDVSSVDYQLMPPGSVIVQPDEVSAAKMLPVSGMSKHIGKTKRLVEGDGLSDYSRLD
uniref:LR9 n=1 Tax=Griffithsia pacifica TaxID=35689 RepID=A0A291FEC1_GRIPA|nr:LR9 [Griffithsia pacifica]5Y6P_ka Chain ka, LR9 [Griffithsia pacifica]5Y6P_kb Chain kb, LR9 [Griffithsia pacifica]